MEVNVKQTLSVTHGLAQVYTFAYRPVYALVLKPAEQRFFFLLGLHLNLYQPPLVVLDCNLTRRSWKSFSPTPVSINCSALEAMSSPCSSFQFILYIRGRWSYLAHSRLLRREM